jgi:diacylglycerol kinase
MKPPRTPSLLVSFGNAFNGLRYALQTQRNARIHLTVTAIVLGIGFRIEPDGMVPGHPFHRDGLDG